MLTKEQLQERRNYIGASDAAIILGISPYKTPYELYLEKNGELDSNSEENDALIIGSLLEPVIINLYEMKTGNKVEVNIPTQFSKEYPFIAVNLDGRLLLDKDTLIEAKSSAVYSQWGTDDDSIPLWYVAQCQQAMYVTGALRTLVPVLIGKTFKVYTINRDEDLIKLIVTKVVEFWAMLQNGLPPEIKTNNDWKLKYNCQTMNDVIEADDEIVGKISLYKNISAQIKELEDQKTQLSAEVLAFMGDHKTLTANSRKLGSIVTKSFKGWDNKALEEDHPELIGAYKTKEVSSAYFLASRN